MNYIGTNVAWTAAIPNSDHGVRINGVPSNAVGGTAAGARSVISGNTDCGISIEGSGAAADVVAGDYVGTDREGVYSCGNGSGGVQIDGAPSNTIGGTAAGAGNLISENSMYRIEISGAGADEPAMLLRRATSSPSPG